jgi:hypothetical protein
MRLLVVCVVATSLVGCSFVAGIHHRTAQPTPSCGWLYGASATDLAVAGVLTAGLESVTSRPSSEEQPSIDEVAALAVGAGLLMITGLDGLENSVRCHVNEHEHERELAKRAREDALRQQSVAAREQAWKLTVEAETAARAGDCARVSELDPKIAAIDTGMHDVVFARDLGVIRCRGSAL